MLRLKRPRHAHHAAQHGNYGLESAGKAGRGLDLHKRWLQRDTSSKSRATRGPVRSTPERKNQVNPKLVAQALARARHALMKRGRVGGRKI